MKKFLSLLLVLTLVSGCTISSFATENYSKVITKDYTIKTLDGKALTQEEFMEYLEKHSDEIVKLDDTEKNRLEQFQPIPATASVSEIGALIAGTWYIPGVGEIIITAAGVMIIGGAVIAAGTWLYNQVVDWFVQRAETRYEDAKEKGNETDNHQEVEGESSLPTKGEPRSSQDLLDDNGELKQRRYYDENGDADMDIDYKHGGVNHEFPHRHYWENGYRGPAVPF